MKFHHLPVSALLLSLATFLPPAFGVSVASTAPGPWVPDQGDGTYKNPVLYADYSDPDAIRVGDDYWLTASSFNEIPGLPILHSKDLVNWEIVNHALAANLPRDIYSRTIHGQGVYAPALRYHDGKFWIFYPDPDYGIYVLTATDPRGQWTQPVLIRAGTGYIDPCPFWDDDGKAYLICGWATSRHRRANLLTLFEMSPDGSKLLGDGKTIIDGRAFGWKTVEGPKLYKRDGIYWVFAPAGGVGGGFQAVYRSHNIWGPYENRNVLDQGSTTINGPHQGAWVDTPGGQDWFLHFQKDGAYGRVVHLEPMRWGKDGWPVIGDDPAGTGKGQPVLVHQKPALPPQPIATPATTDEFNAPALGLQWQWEANPSADWWSLSAAPGSLRLACVPLPAPDARWDAPNLLLQKFPSPVFTATTVLRLAPSSDGDAAGLIVFGRDYAWLGLRQIDRQTRLQLVTHRKDTTKETVVATASPNTPAVFLRVTVGADALCRFSWSENGADFTPIGGDFHASAYGWVGAKVGLFASSVPGAPSSAHADFDWFRVTK